MKKNTQATSIIEAIIVLLIVVSWIVGVYWLVTSSQKLSVSTKNRIEAIQIARDGLEAFTNIRDTNWLIFAGDRANCWNVLNYNPTCIGNTGTTTDIAVSANQWIRISRNANNQFFIGIQNHGWNNNYLDTWYIWLFRIFLDAQGFYTQSTGTILPNAPVFTREIRVEYITPSGTIWSSNESRMRVTAIIQWMDVGVSTPKRLEMSTELTNWK